MSGPLARQSEAAPPEALSSLLHRVFGHRDFRPHQQQVCEAAAAGRDLLLVMPTGAGKSLCYQLPALARRASGEAGAALVISPLIALMDDQAARLNALNLRVARIHSGLDRDASRQACRDYLAGELDFLFIAPERMRIPGFPDMLAKRKPALIAIDEAHCISQWGHDFRPDYRTLGQHLPALRPAPILALTATATPTVQRDILAQLHLVDPAVFITGFRRTNLAVEVVELSKPQRHGYALKLLQSPAARPAIVYAGSRKDAEELAAKLHPHFPTAAYHAGLPPPVREKVQRAFLSGQLDVVVATIAFGMGVDKADVRTVVHVALPGSVEAFYQEIGRAGRDGLPSRSVLLHGYADRRLQEFFLERSYPPLSDLQTVARALTEDLTPVNDLHNRLVKKKSNLDRETLDRCIEKLLATGVALMDMEGSVRLADSPEADSPKPSHWQTNYEAQIAARRAQIDRMVAFAEATTTCRMASLVQHFGDTSDKSTHCGLCDVCNPAGTAADRAQGTSGFSRQATSDQREALRSILIALDAHPTSTRKLFEQVTRDRNPSPALRDRKDFDALVAGLARAALITVTSETFRGEEGTDVTYRKVAITAEGRLTGSLVDDNRTLDTVWIRSATTAAKATSKKRQRRELYQPGPKAQEPAPRAPQRAESPTYRPSPQNSSFNSQLKTGRNPPLDFHPNSTPQSATRIPRPPAARVAARPTPAATPPVPLNPAQQALDLSLRAWRKDVARQAGLPSFFILSDSVLHNIVLALPQSVADLRNVRGVGPEKLEAFGAAVLSLCRA